MKKCPSCGAEPTETKCNIIRYIHSESCKIGRVTRSSTAGCVGIDHPYPYRCSKCKTYYECKEYANPGDSLECPICWSIAESENENYSNRQRL